MVSPAFGSKLPYDANKDFAPIGVGVYVPFLIVVHSSVPAKSVKELIDLARAQPGKINFGSPGTGTPNHLGIELLKAMTGCIQHRGPDSDGFFRDGDAGLGMRRLKIIDLAGGDQPISNDDGSLVIIFNGEIYNYQPLREGLLARGHQLKTRSDTEVVLRLPGSGRDRALARLDEYAALLR